MLFNFSLHICPLILLENLVEDFILFPIGKLANWELFMRYAGIAVLKDVQPAVQHEHFLYLAISMRLLLTSNQEKKPATSFHDAH